MTLFTATSPHPQFHSYCTKKEPNYIYFYINLSIQSINNADEIGFRTDIEKAPTPKPIYKYTSALPGLCALTFILCQLCETTCRLPSFHQWNIFKIQFFAVSYWLMTLLFYSLYTRLPATGSWSYAAVSSNVSNVPLSSDLVSTSVSQNVWLKAWKFLFCIFIS